MLPTFLNNIKELHPAQTDLFQKSITQNQLGHAYLLYGYEGVGKEAFAIELAAHLLCETGPLSRCGQCSSCRQMNNLWHPDFYYVFPVPSKSNMDENTITQAKKIKSQNPFVDIRMATKNIFIGIEAIRNLKNELYKHPQQGERKVALIQDVDTMRTEGANALLKILEEPPPYVYFVLTTSKISRLLPTILSRCQLVHFDRPVSDKIHDTLGHYLKTDNSPDLTNSLRFANLNIKKALYYLNEDFYSTKNASADFFKYLLQKEWSLAHAELINIINKKDNRTLQLFLEFVIVYFFDLFYYLSDEISLIKNSDMVEYFQEHNFPVKNIPWISQNIEVIIQFKDTLDSPFNLNIFLVMDAMYHKLKKIVSHFN